MTPKARREFIRRLPLADLHRHFDGSVRPETLWEMSEKYYSAVPELDFEQFRRYLVSAFLVLRGMGDTNERWRD